jgi:hypothetical protein
MSKARRRAALALATLALAAGTVVVPASLANPSPPTNGGNGGGHSGQCTGNPVDRPAVCPAT